MPTTTATARRKMLAKIRTAASRFVETNQKGWAERLLASFAEVDPNTQAVIRRELCRRGFHWKALPTMKRQLGELFFFSIYPAVQAEYWATIGREYDGGRFIASIPDLWDLSAAAPTRDHGTDAG